MKKIVTLLTAGMLLSGCTTTPDDVTSQVMPLANVNMLMYVCVYPVEKTIFDYNNVSKLLADKLDALNISYRLTEKEDVSGCSYTIAYQAKLAGEPPYLASALFKVKDTINIELGYANYQNPTNRSQSAKEQIQHPDEKINELLTGLFGQ